MKSADPELAIEIDILARILADLPVRSIVSYETLSKAVGYSVQDRPFALLKARLQAEETTGMRLETVRCEGIKKMDAAAVAGIGAKVRNAIARKARKHARRLTGLKYNDIDAATQSRIDAERSLLGAISATAKADIERVQEHTSTGPLVASRIFDLMNRFA